MKKEFSTNDHIHPDNGKNPHNQDSPQNGTWNDHQLEQLFGEALGDIPTADETRKAWQTFIRRHRIRHQSIRRITIPGIAAAVIALVLVFQPFLQPEPQEVEVFTSLEVPEEITFREEGKRIIVSTPPATITSVQLSDGSKVLLSANSRLEYLKEFTDTIRSIKLSGEARFEVAKDASRPFIVCTEQLQTRVLGTVFDVNTHYTRGVRTVLVEGAVALEWGDQKEIRMKPGELADFDRTTTEVTLKEVDVTSYISWKEGYFVFEDEPLEEIMHTLSLWYDKEFLFVGKQSRALHFSGHIKRYERIETILSAITDVTGVEFRMNGQIILIH